MDESWLIFTDLDGTLLDHKTYSWEPALPALERLKEKRIPIIFCSSKTSGEIRLLRRRLSNRHPFICENGGGVYIPIDYFPFEFPFTRKTEGFLVIEIGTPYPILRQSLKSIEKDLGVSLRGYGDMTVDEIAALTGLPVEEAELAKIREFDEPFLIPGNEERVPSVLNRIECMGLHWTKGGRFFHILGKSDKGKAVEMLKDIFKRQYRKVITVGIGDNDNDLPMLKVTDHPILVQRSDGSFAELKNVPHLARVRGNGPVGWNKALLNLITD